MIFSLDSSPFCRRLGTKANGTDLKRSDVWERLPGAIVKQSRQDAAPTEATKSLKSVPLELRRASRHF